MKRGGMQQRLTRPDIGRFVVNGLLIGLTLAALLPLLWMVSVSFMPTGASAGYPPPLLPNPPTSIHYIELFERAGMLRHALNSAGLAAAATLLALTFNVLAGYAFAKLHFRGRDRAFQVLMATMVIPGQVAMLPLFLMLKTMGLVNTYMAILVPALAGVFGIFLVRQYARSIPDELIEAARIDGASELRIFLQIVLPLLRPILVTLALFTFLGTWNDFMWPLIVLTDQPLQTLPVALASLSREHVQDNELMMAGAVVTIVPVLLLFVILQKHYISGLLSGGVKG